MKAISYIFLLACLVFSCRKQEAGVATSSTLVHASDSVRHAGLFRIETHEDYTLAIVHNPWEKEKVLQRYVLIPKTAALPASLPEGVLIRTPLARTVSYGAVQCSFFG
ncbi:MAG: ABC transporter substrate-binding protein, partial [Dysgonamonadaceae bacterium]|nr:ABC transporter substrate-binding protein [Dysgonamonadaceae bacterium]